MDFNETTIHNPITCQNRPGMNHLRPHQVFDKVEEADRLAVICLPQRNSLTSMLERAILVSLLKITKPLQIFEFGTYFGETTLILAANSKAQVYSLDLDQDHLEQMADKLDEFEMANVRRRLPARLAFQGTPYETHIKTLLGDSTAFDLSPFYQKMDFILIDGGHQLGVVTSDTQQAFHLLHPGRLQCIVWHDYGNPHYQITDYLDDLSHELQLFHVIDTTFVFYLNNGYSNLFT